MDPQPEQMYFALHKATVSNLFHWPQNEKIAVDRVLDAGLGQNLDL
jgi:hypothetical protein